MCVLIVKPSNVPVPSVAILEACVTANPDGFGFATPTKYFRTLDPDEFIEEVSKIPVSEPAIIHCRWATTGSVCVENCHPFFDEATGTYFAHNGVLPFHPRADITDSEYAFRNFLVPSIKAHGFGSASVKRSVNIIIGSSKFAMLNGSRICMYGNFEKMSGCGCFFSNLRFMTYLYRRVV